MYTACTWSKKLMSDTKRACRTMSKNVFVSNTSIRVVPFIAFVASIPIKLTTSLFEKRRAIATWKLYFAARNFGALGFCECPQRALLMSTVNVGINIRMQFTKWSAISKVDIQMNPLSGTKWNGIIHLELYLRRRWHEFERGDLGRLPAYVPPDYLVKRAWECIYIFGARQRRFTWIAMLRQGHWWPCQCRFQGR